MLRTVSSCTIDIAINAIAKGRANGVSNCHMLVAASI